MEPSSETDALADLDSRLAQAVIAMIMARSIFAATLMKCFVTSSLNLEITHHTPLNYEGPTHLLVR